MMPTVRTVLLLYGMRENRCRDLVAGALEAVAGVIEVDVNLFRARATVIHHSGCLPGALIQAVGRIGYEAHRSSQSSEANVHPWRGYKA